ncbi:MAG: T9SS type A sorting domain-containing protein, partial [Bacteroidota bacterium]
GTPNYFTYIKTHDSQHLGIIEFHSDWTNPSNATFGNTHFLPVNPFNTLGGFDNGIPQKESTEKLETLSDRLMYRLQFRRFGDYSSMVLNHSVDAGSGIAGVRWYELRDTGSGWSVYQQSTYAPDNNSRWMGSIAQDTAGSIALGYSVSSAEMFPAIRYTGRMKTDPLNVMTINERTIINGGGSQTGNWGGRSRWGDYSAMSIDPSSPTTFWFTTEYYPVTSGSSWQTRIGSFTFSDVFSSAASATPSILCSSDPDSVQLNAYAYGGSMNYSFAWSSVPAGFNSAISNPRVHPLENTLYISAVSDGSQTRYDTVSVKIVPMATASAGDDTIVCWYASPIPIYGIAENYSAFVWGTSGDGYFSNRYVLTPDYFPGMQDKTSGQVDLILVVKPVSPCHGNVQRIKHVVLDPCTGIGEVSENEIKMNIQPNPAHENVILTISGIRSKKSSLSLINTAGHPVISFEMMPAADGFVKIVDVSNYPKGIYMLQLKTDTMIRTEKLVIQ